MRYVDADF